MPGILDHLVNPLRVTASAQQLDLSDDYTRTIVRGALAEREDKTKAEEAEVCSALDEMLEERYAKFIIKKDTVKADTLRKYAISCKAFLAWCDQAGLSGMDTRQGRAATPTAVAGFLSDELQSGAKPALIRRHSAALSHLHRWARLSDPTTDPL